MEKPVCTRRRKFYTDPTCSVPCPYCKGFYSKKNLRNHIRLNCLLKKNFDLKKDITGMNNQVKSRATLPRIHSKTNNDLKYVIFPRLKDDRISRVACNDELAVTFGNLLATKYSSSTHHHKEIRNKIRLTGRILLEMQKLDPNIKKLEDLFAPEHFDAYVKAVHRIAGLE